MTCHGGHTSCLEALKGRGKCRVSSVFLLNPACYAFPVIHITYSITCFMPEFKTVSAGPEQKLSHQMSQRVNSDGWLREDYYNRTRTCSYYLNTIFESPVACTSKVVGLSQYLTGINRVIFWEFVILNPCALFPSVIFSSNKFHHLFASCVKKCFPVFTLNFLILQFQCLLVLVFKPCSCSLFTVFLDQIIL